MKKRTIMNQIYKIGLLTAFTVACLSGCGKNKATTAFALQGSFQTAANSELSARAGGIGCVINELKVIGWSMKLSQVSYEDSACKEKAIGKLTYSGSFSIGDPLPFAPSARAINYKISKVAITPIAKSWTTLFGVDLSKDCNIADSRLNEEVEVTGLDCGVFGRFPQKDAVYFASFAENADFTLFSPLPHEALGNVGTDDAPAARNQDLVLRFVKN